MRYHFKDLDIDPVARTVFKNGEEVRLPDLSFDVLIMLVKAAPQPVSTSELVAGVWRAEHVSDETVAQRITLLRKALGDDAKDPLYIRTKRGAGYVLRGLPEVQASVPSKPKDVPTGGFRYPSALIGIAALLLLVLGFYQYGFNPYSTESSLKEAAPVSPIDVMVTRAEALLRLHQARETDRALAMLRDALKTDPAHFGARLSLSFALSTKATKFGGDGNDRHEAEALARALTEEAPKDSNAWSALGYALDSQGRLDESLAAYQLSYQLDPQNAPAMSSAAYGHLLRGNLYEALRLEFRARHNGGTSRYAEIQIAQSLELIGHAAARIWQEKAASLNPGQVVVLSELAKSKLRRGDPEGALAVLANLSGDDENAPLALQVKGRAALMMGDADKAATFLQAAGYQGSYDLAALKAVLGETREAEKLLRPENLVDQMASPEPVSRVHIAELYATLGHEQQVAAALSQAINLGWRDALWLQQSPFLKDFMTSEAAKPLLLRIERELAAQRTLILADERLQESLQS